MNTPEAYTPQAVLGITDLARECGVDAGTIRRYLKHGLEPDFVTPKGTPYFSRDTLQAHVETVTHIKATNIALSEAKRAKARRNGPGGRFIAKTVTLTQDELAARYPTWDPKEQCCVKLVYDEGGSLPASVIGGEP